MEVIGKINNNAAVCLDSAGNEMIAIGTGIGFPRVPYQLEDLSLIQRTYYDINPMYLSLLNEISEDIFQLSGQIVERFRQEVNEDISSNLIFTLADHINFAIERMKKGMTFENPLHYDIQHLYQKEYQIGLDALKMIQQTFKVRMPKVEATNIALHLINAEAVAIQTNRVNSTDQVINDVVDIIGNHFQMFINREHMNYSRFATHFQYLLKRESSENKISSDNLKMFESAKEQYVASYEAVLKIKEYLREELDFDLSDEEALYLILHVNRLSVREGL